jgi:hypothetical protein
MSGYEVSGIRAMTLRFARVLGNFKFGAIPMNDVALLEFVNELLT